MCTIKKIGLACIVALASVVTVGRAELVGWWRFDGNYEDSSGKGNHGTPVGQPTFETGQFGQALSLNISSTDQYINCGTNLGFTTIGDGGTSTGLTIAVWVNRSIVGGDRKICGNITETSWAAGHGYKLAIYNDLLELDIRDSVGRFFSRDVAPPATGPSLAVAGTWFHVAMVLDDVADTLTEYINGTPGRVWINVTRGIAASTSEFRIGTDTPNHNTGRVFRGLLDDLRIYDNPLTPAEIQDVIKGLGPSRGRASSPKPEDRAADVPRDAALSWAAGAYPCTHDVYLGLAFEDVNTASRTTPKGVLISQDQAATTFQPSTPLEFGKTYYWRVDEVNTSPDHTIHKGLVWSFTVEPYSYAVRPTVATASSQLNNDTGPEKTIDGSGLDDKDQHGTGEKTMWLTSTGPKHWIQFQFDNVYKLHQLWVWNFNQVIEPILGFGAEKVLIEASQDGDTWTQVGTYELAQAPGETTGPTSIIDLSGVVARYIRLTIESTWGGLAQTGLSEVRFYQVPVRAFNPTPADGASG
ncbi:MAG: discoidin domain-containing protein, partial [Sedimentisphaerales bacterium]|nr:discoidin domain-containing protein [Sedimentisphaerales bacterium]